MQILINLHFNHFFWFSLVLILLNITVDTKVQDVDIFIDRSFIDKKSSV